MDRDEPQRRPPWARGTSGQGSGRPGGQPHALAIPRLPTTHRHLTHTHPLIHMLPPPPAGAAGAPRGRPRGRARHVGWVQRGPHTRRAAQPAQEDLRDGEERACTCTTISCRVGPVQGPYLRGVYMCGVELTILGRAERIGARPQQVSLQHCSIVHLYCRAVHCNILGMAEHVGFLFARTHAGTSNRPHPGRAPALPPRVRTPAFVLLFSEEGHAFL